MQSIIRNTPNIHPIFDDIERFYTYTSEKSDTCSLFPLILDNSFKYLVELFEDCGDFSCNVLFKDKHYEPIEVPKYDSKNVILTFSGGKDSVASALRLKEDGYAVHLYHLKGINAVYDEYKAVEILAKKLDLPLYIDTIKLSGHHQYVEHPMKNIIIANSALQWGIRENISTNLVFGNYLNSSVDNDNFTWCGGDDIETWEAYEDIINSVLDNFVILMNLDDMKDTLDIFSNHQDILPYTLSCIGRAGLREYNRKRVESKYHIHLLDNRCGLCYKCAVEYIYNADHNLCEFNQAYYDNCFRILKTNYKKETGENPAVSDVWNYYLIYDISKSHLQNK